MNLSFPADLPVSQRREEIRTAMQKHSVVIVCGDTGSGKTTQLPKIALELGYGQKGRRIGCTQPRRIAATSVAARLAEEVGVPLGQEVGYQIRFEDCTDRQTTRVKFMTDGVLLAETRQDPELRQYDVIIVDEAHERSLNIDFILGYLHRTLTRRRDLRVVISSATLDAGAFSEFFGGAPVVEVEGRTYPIEDLWQPVLFDEEPLADQVGRAVESLAEIDPLGDTLVFLPGEREIREAVDLLEGRKCRDMLVLPLYARQASVEQNAIFHPIRSKRRVILATNVAETSLTIPGIRFVVDSGLARISRHDVGSGIQRLRIEPISKASARQRRGRCGRVQDGVCVRLGTEEEFQSRPEFTDPEIRRSNLSGVVLQMEHLGLGDPLEFPFVDPPSPKRVAQAYRELEEIGALTKQGRAIHMTGCGHSLARLPVDPRVGRILIAAESEGCLAEGLVLASALAVQDPRERPRDRQQAADEAHAKFRDRRSDFTMWLRLWYAADTARRGSGNRFRRFCRDHFLNHRRMQEWFRLHGELRDTLREMKWKLPSGKQIDDPADSYSEPLHRAVLAAIPSRIGLSRGKGKGYKGAGDSTFWIFPGSGLFSTAASWVMAFELVETAKLYARNVAGFDPGWFEKVAPHLCRYRYSNPQWSKEQGAVYGEERVLAYGLPIVDKRRIHYARVDQRVAREIFITEALVNGNTRAPLSALRQNRETMAAAERLEHKLRRIGGLLHLPQITAFYEDRLPDSICTQRDFERWASKQALGALDFTIEDCIVSYGEPIRFEDYPDVLEVADGNGGSLRLDLRYLHSPTDPEDGVTSVIPLVELLHLPQWVGEHLVPGWVGEKVSALLRCLHKDLRVLLPSNREVTENFLSEMQEGRPDCGLVEELSAFLQEEYGIRVAKDLFDLKRLSPHLRMHFEVVDDHGKVIGYGDDLEALQTRLAPRVKDRFSYVSKGRYTRRDLRKWDFGDLPHSVSLDSRTEGYPALYEEGRNGLALRLWPSAECAARHHRLGLARLFRIEYPESARRFETLLFSAQNTEPTPRPAHSSQRQKDTKNRSSGTFHSLGNAFEALERVPTPRAVSSVSPRPAYQSCATNERRFLTAVEEAILSRIGAAPAEQKGDLARGILARVIGAPRAQLDWEKAVIRCQERLLDEAAVSCTQVSRILRCVAAIDQQLRNAPPAYAESIKDARTHLGHLMAPGWLLTNDLLKMLPHFEGLELRLTRMFGAPPAKDLQKLERYTEEFASLGLEMHGCECGQCPLAAQYEKELTIEFDLRLKYFAPELRARLK